MLTRLSNYLFGKGDPPPPSPSTTPRPQLTPWPAPLEQPPAPEQLLTRNWSHPFGDRSDPIQQLTQLAKASNGFYPMGVHGSWHGGVHFDGGTAGALDQSRVLCLADGEVVAYRIPSTTPTTRYVLFPEPAFDAPFASGFVLVRHRIQAPAIEGSDETPPGLTFYSLYMHLEDWAAYDGSTLDRPQFWLESDEKWVKDEANDLHKGQRGLKVTGHPSSSRTLDILAPGTQVAVSGTDTHRKLENTPGPASLRNPDGTLRGYVAARFLPLRAGELFPVKADILNVRAEPDGQAAQLGELARDTMVRFSGNGDFVKLEYVEQYVRAADLRSEYVPARRDGVFVPETPIPIKAGELIGHIGPYQNARDSLPRRHLHLEVFCLDWFPGFLKDSRAWAERLPAKEKTWLKLPKGTAVFFHQEGLNPKSLPASGQPDLASDADLLVPKSLLDNLPAKKRIIHTSARQTRTWYRLEGLFHDANGNLVDGWVEDPGEASWVSPWSWDGYEVIETSGSPVQGMAYRMVQDKNTSEEDRMRLRQQADAWNNGPLLTRLYEIIDRNHDRQMCADEVRTALNTPALAQALSKIVLRSESEWYYRDGKWDALDTVFGHTTSAPLVNWMAEKTRIRELSWWGEVMGPLEFPKGSGAYFLHPLGLSNLFALRNSNSYTYRIFHHGLIEVTPPFDEKDKANAKYIYIDASGRQHNFGEFKGKKAIRWKRKAEKGTEEIYLIDASTLGSNSARKFGFRFVDTQRTYLNQAALGSLIGAMMEVGFEDIASTGFSMADGSPGESESHINGENGDFRFLRTDKNWTARMYLDQGAYVPFLDEHRQEAFNEALYKFGWRSQLAWRYVKNGAPRLLARTQHYKNHHHHLHVGKYTPNLKEVADD